jgi:hypothetical protein
VKGNLQPNDSRCGLIELQLAAALVAYALDEAHFKSVCKGVWPLCDFYRGGTHLRVMIEGHSGGESFYVNLV